MLSPQVPELIKNSHYRHTCSTNSLVEEVVTSVTNPHLLLDTKLGYCGCFGWALSTEHLATCSTVVLQWKNNWWKFLLFLLWGLYVQWM